MPRSLSNLVFKWLSFSGLASRPATIAPASFYPSGMRYNTSVPNEPDTHDDFKPTNKLESSDLSLKDLVEQDVKDNPVMLYMKGVPELPQCGFSSLAVKVLKLYQVPLASRNILEDPELKSAVKAFRYLSTIYLSAIYKPKTKTTTNFVRYTETGSGPTIPLATFPQIFIKGELVGGSDIILNMHQLKEKLKDISGSQEKKSE